MCHSCVRNHELLWSAAGASPVGGARAPATEIATVAIGSATVVLQILSVCAHRRCSSFDKMDGKYSAQHTVSDRDRRGSRSGYLDSFITLTVGGIVIHVSGPRRGENPVLRRHEEHGIVSHVEAVERKVACDWPRRRMEKAIID
jgi:hypothetical protein